MNTKLEGMIETSLDSLKKIVDVNTVVGEPIKTESGTTVIPVSKVSLGYVSGGTDFATKRSNEKNFAGGGGSGVTILPLGFLVIKENGNVEFLAANVKTPSGPVGSIVDLIEKSPSIIEKYKNIFSSPKKEEAPAPSENTDTTEA